MPDRRAPRSALVLGATSDIAVACVAELGRRGLQQAVLAARDPGAAIDAVAAAAPDVRTTPRRWDATEVSDHRALATEAHDHLGGIDLALCAVGMLGHHAGRAMGPEQVDEMVRTNFAGPAAALAAVAEVMAADGRGTIVVLSSVAGQRARRSNYVYGSSKAGLDVFAQGLGDALVGTGVRVVVVRPGFVVSRMTEGLDPAPFATDPPTVARTVAGAVTAGHREVVPVPGLLGPLFGVLRAAPRPLWRRIAGDR